MAAAALISPEEYLSTSYEDGDREYVDGGVLERTLGEFDHGDAQTAFAAYLRSNYKAVVTALVRDGMLRTENPEILVPLSENF